MKRSCCSFSQVLRGIKVRLPWHGSEAAHEVLARLGHRPWGERKAHPFRVGESSCITDGKLSDKQHSKSGPHLTSSRERRKPRQHPCRISLCSLLGRQVERVVLPDANRSDRAIGCHPAKSPGVKENAMRVVRSSVLHWPLSRIHLDLAAFVHSWFPPLGGPTEATR